MKKMGIVAVLCLAKIALWTVGCGSSSNDDSCDMTVESCDMTVENFHTCTEYCGLTSVQSAVVRSDCERKKGTWGGSCPTAGALGTCVVMSAGVAASATFYPVGGLTNAEAADIAKTACESQGSTWMAL